MSSTTIYVGNISYSTTEATLRGAFEAAGRLVREVAIMTDRSSGRSKGYAFVKMDSDIDAMAAIRALDGRELDGRRLCVNDATPRQPRA